MQFRSPFDACKKIGERYIHLISASANLFSRWSDEASFEYLFIAWSLSA